ncbi:E3 ubiquitin-protein ligase TRIM71-like [Mytilus edulis]|uniref:E3 ubiquitin-protein ligase TRIM71-like n=1 Tax=Mytilus edulis TaxID=6550 RepID=UPI0039F0BCFC
MATSTTICGPCSERYTTKPSAYWCSDCQEAICDDCQEHHKVLKVTRSHELIPIDKYKSLPSFITDIQQSCTYHNEKYQQYCVAHLLPICFKCIKEHQKCNVIPLDEVTNNAKTSGHLQDLETRLVDLLQNIDRIKKDRKANLYSIQEKKERYLAEIQQRRNQINKHLDKLETEIIQDLEEKECQCKENIQKILSEVEEKKNLIIENQTNLQSIKQHASDLQTFLAMRNIEVKVLENEQYLQSLVETNKLDLVDLTCNVDPGVLSILDSLKTFGSIEIDKKSSSIRLIREKDKQAQLQVTPTKSLDDLKLILQKTITTGGMKIRGCCISVNGEFFFTDYNLRKRLNVIASDGKFKFDMLLDPSYGYDITIINEKTIAITSGSSSEHIGIDIIDIESRKKIKFISLPDRPWGITRDQDSLFVCVERRGIYRVNTLDYTTSHLISCKLSGSTYISVFAEKIYYTDWLNHTVDCCDRKGSSVWRFKKESVLRNPRGITVDNEGNVFVVGEHSSNVVMISNDGKHYKQILTIDDGLRKPSAIFFDKQTRKLLVANKQETAFLYSVT